MVARETLLLERKGHLPSFKKIIQFRSAPCDLAMKRMYCLRVPDLETGRGESFPCVGYVQ
jgi:hypothetical protein